MKYNSIKSKFLIAILLIIAISSSLFANSKMSDPGQGLPFLWKSINVLHMANDFNNIAAPPAPPPPPPFVIGDIEAGDSIVIVYRVTVNMPLVPTNTTEIINQGTVSGGNFASVLTDDPSVVGGTDPTITPADNATCTVPALNATINTVNVVSDNNGTPDVASIALCNNGTNTLTFGAFTDNNSPNPDPVKVVRTVTATNVTYSEVSGVDLLSTYTATTRNVTLISTTAQGTLVLNYVLFADGNNNNILDPGECKSDAVQYTITVNPIPNVVATPASQTVCSAVAINTIVLSSSTTGTTYAWTRDNAATVTGITASGTGNISGTLTNTTFAPVTVTFTITPSANGCAGTPITATVLVNPTPNALATPSSQMICSGATITTILLTSSTTGTTYAWTRDNAATVTGITASGTGNISGSLTNTTFAPITVTFTITTTANGCAGPTTTATVLVNPTPNAIATPASQTICSGATITTIALTSSTTGTTYTWTRDNAATVTGITASGSGNISGALTNTTFAPITVTFTITPTANGCTGPTTTATVLVNPGPDAQATPSSQTICSGSAITTIALTSSTSGTTYAWTRDNSATVTGITASGTGNISGSLTNTTFAPITVTFTITPTASGCVGPTITATVLVNPTPNAIATPSSQTICSAAPITTIVLTSGASGTTYAWTRDNAATVTGINASGSGNISGTLTNTTFAPITVTFTITPTVNGCSGPTTTATVLVNPTPNAVATPSSQTICSGATITTIVLTSSTTGTTYAWTRDNAASVTGINASGTGNISGSLTNTTFAPITVTFTITPTANGCAGPTTTATVLVNPTPNAVATPSSQMICSGATITTIALTSNTTGTTYAWTRDNAASVTGINASGTGNISGSLTNTTFAPITVTFTITPTANGCAGPTTTATVLVNPTPNAVATPSSQTICSGATITTIALTSSTTGTTYAWTRDNAATVTGITASGTGNISGSLTNTTFSPITVTFTITPTANGCPGAPITATVLVNPTPNAVATPASQTTCSGQAITTVIISGAVSGTTYNWTRDNAATVTGITASGSGNISGTLTNTTNAPITVTFTITPTANGCNGAPITATILVNPTPDALATPSSQIICSASSITTIVLTGTVPSTIFNWVRNNTATVTGIAASGSGNISGTLTNTTNAPVTVTFTIIPTAFGCQPGAPILATVLVNPTPVVTIPGNIAFCNNTSVATNTLNFISNVSGTTITWSNNNTSIGLGAGSIGNTLPAFTATNITNAPIIATITVNSIANGCPGATQTFTITVNPTPNAVATPSSQTICSATAISTIVLTGAVTGTTYAWARNNTAAVTGISASGSGNISGVLTNTTSAPITVTFTITPTANGCVGPTTTATVLVNPIPNATATPASQSICTGSYITPIVLTGTVAGTAFNWTRNNTGTVTGIGAFGSGNITGVLVNTSSAPITVTFTIIPTANGCTGNAITATVIVNPTPTGTISISPNPACVGSTVQLSASGGATYNWSGPQGFASTLQNPTILLTSHLQAGQYSVTITSGAGCFVVKYATLKVNYPPVATATFEQNTACTGSTLQLHGTGAGAYAWTGPNGFTSNLKDPTIPNVTSANSGTYTLTVISPNGCTATTSINVTINTPPVVSANPTLTQTCEGSTVQLTATGTGTFSWSGPAGWVSNNQSPVITNIPLYMSGVFTVTLTASTGCSSTANVTIKVYEQIKAVATATPDPVCEGQSLQLHAEGGSQYLWTGPAGFNSNESDPRIDNITLGHAGSYYVYIFNEGGCDGYAEVKVEVKPSIKATASATPNPVPEYKQVQFNSSNGMSHSWTGPLGFTSTLQNPLIKKVTRYMAGIYTVTIINENGCPSIAKVNLRVLYTNKGVQTITDEGEELTARSETTATVYPNPTNDLLYFETTSLEAIEYVIFDSSGKINSVQTTSTGRYISTSALPSGVYQIRWKPLDSEEWIVSKFVKIR